VICAFSEAEQVLSPGPQDNPESIPLYLAWARLLTAQHQKESVEAVLMMRRTRMPKPIAAAEAIGDPYSQDRNPERVLAEYQRAASIAPKNTEIKTNSPAFI
jgi:hypothetical protein